MKKIFKYLFNLLTEINERRIYNRDEEDISMLKGEENSKFLLVSRQSARGTYLSALAVIISIAAFIISLSALVFSIIRLK